MGNMPTHLDEANVHAALSEALTADVQAVLADETRAMCADAAVDADKSAIVLSLIPLIEYVRVSSVRTIRGRPCRSRVGESTRRSRASCWWSLDREGR